MINIIFFLTKKLFLFEYYSIGDNMLNFINKIVWLIATISIVISSLYFSMKLKFLQLKIKTIFSCLVSKTKTDKIKPFNVLMITLAGRIGVGSIAGIALCIYIGGIGSIFWLWIMTFFSAILAYVETVLGGIYKEKDGKFYKGGPSYYLKNGLGKKKLGGIYAILIIISYIGGFLSIQTNTITKSLNQIININPYFIGIIIVIITSFIIFGGLTKISDATSKIVPVMGVFYLLITIYIIINNISSIPNIFLSIVSEAFNFKSFYSGFLTSFVVGIQRGIFSNEAGLGTGSIASSISDINPVKQGYIQVLGVYITSLIICTSTAFIILTSNYLQPVFNDLNGIEITGYAFSYHLGKLGDIFIFISILLFSFSTILTGYYYGESSLKYFFSTIKSKYLYILKVFTLIILFLGCILSSNLLWKIVDILVALLAIINIYAMFNLRNTVFNETNYSKYDKM